MRLNGNANGNKKNGYGCTEHDRRGNRKSEHDAAAHRGSEGEPGNLRKSKLKIA